MLGYVLDDLFVQHRAPSGHPERPARAEAVRDALLAAGIASRGTHIATRADLVKRSNDLFKVVKSGKVKIETTKTYKLADAAQAHRDLEGRKTTGSVILRP